MIPVYETRLTNLRVHPLRSPPGFRRLYGRLFLSGAGEVFANARTGNLPLLGVHLSQGEYSLVLPYLFPVLGIALADIVRLYEIDRLSLEADFHYRWRPACWQWSVPDIEPGRRHLASLGLRTMPVESFRKIRGNGVARPPPCRSAISQRHPEPMLLFLSAQPGNPWEKWIFYWGIILAFILGPSWATPLSSCSTSRPSLISSALLFLAFLMMFSKRQEAAQGRILLTQQYPSPSPLPVG